MKPTSGSFFSLVAPTYNEAANIAPFLARASAVLEARLPGRYEIIVVDDDSPDLTWQAATAAAKALPAVHVIRRQNERGLATAVVAGWKKARGDWLGVIDADLQHPPEILVQLLDAMNNGADLAVGSRNAAGGGVSTWSVWRRLISRSAQAVGRIALPAARRVSDPMSGLFVVRRAAVDVAALAPRGYKILLEVLVRGRATTIIEVPYVFEERTRGGSKATAAIYVEYLAHVWALRKTR
jgi:dolichol-phosphate mannosyltransferase